MQFDFDLDDKREARRRLIYKILVWILEIGLMILLAYLLVTYGLERVSMAGQSMKGTLQDKDKILINKLSYRFGNPKRFDVIVYRQQGKEHSYYTVRRVIGLPGETVQIQDGNVYIDGEKIEEKVEVEKMENGGLALEEITLDDDEYFVLGDNRNASEDSRFANVGNIYREDIIGKAWIRLNGFTFINSIKK